MKRRDAGQLLSCLDEDEQKQVAKYIEKLLENRGKPGKKRKK